MVSIWYKTNKKPWVPHTLFWFTCRVTFKPVLWICCLGDGPGSLVCPHIRSETDLPDGCEEGMVTISPGKGLGAGVEMGAGDELGSFRPSIVVQLQENIHSHPTRHRDVGEDSEQAGCGRHSHGPLHRGRNRPNSPETWGANTATTILDPGLWVFSFCFCFFMRQGLLWPVYKEYSVS